MGHDWEGVVLKLFRGKDFTCTVMGAESVTERYRRVHFSDGGRLQAIGIHPTMWVRLWFDNAGKPHLAVPKHRVKALGYWRAA